MQYRFHKILALLGVSFLILPGAKAAVRLSDIEAYLNKITTLEATFKQWDQNGALTKGKLFLQRPGFLRMDAQAPSQMLIVADGTTLFFIDRGTLDVSYTPIDQSLATFLLDEKINFLEGFDIEKFEENDKAVSLKIRRKAARDLGTLTLVFRRSPLMIIQWILEDAQNMTTMVHLSNIIQGRPISKKLFDPSNYLQQER